MIDQDKISIEGFEELMGSDLIQETFLFQNLNFTEAMELARICRREVRQAGDLIIEENALGQALYLVEKGKVKVVKGEGKKTKKLATLGRGELFGEMSLIEDALTSAGVIADTAVELVAVRREDFETLLTKNESLALKVYKSFCKTLSERLRRTSEQFLSDTPEQAKKIKKPAGKKPGAKAAKTRAKVSKKGGRG